MFRRDSSGQRLCIIAPRLKAPQASRPNTPQLSQEPQPTGHGYVSHESSEAINPSIVDNSVEDDGSATRFARCGPGSRGTFQSELSCGTPWDTAEHTSWDTSWDTPGELTRDTFGTISSEASINDEPAFIYTETASDLADSPFTAPETSSKAFANETGTLTRLMPFNDEPSLLENSWDPDGWSGPAFDAINTIPESRQTDYSPSAPGDAVKPRSDDVPGEYLRSPRPVLVGLCNPDELTDFNIRGREHTVEADLGEQASQMADDCEKVNPSHVQQLCYTLTDMLLDAEVIAGSGDTESCGDSEEQSDTDQSLLHLPFSKRVGSPSVSCDESLHDTEASPALADPVLESGPDQAFGRRRGGDRSEDQQRDSDCTVQPPDNKKRRGSSNATENDRSNKRRRLNDKRHDGHDSEKDDEYHEDPGQGPSQSGRRSILSRGRPFACPCWKRDPLEFTRCHEWKTKDIDSVRRHIEDTHRKILIRVSDQFETVRKTKMTAVRKWHAFHQILSGDDDSNSSRCDVSPYWNASFHSAPVSLIGRSLAACASLPGSSELMTLSGRFSDVLAETSRSSQGSQTSTSGTYASPASNSGGSFHDKVRLIHRLVEECEATETRLVRERWKRDLLEALKCLERSTESPISSTSGTMTTAPKTPNTLYCDSTVATNKKNVLESLDHRVASKTTLFPNSVRTNVPPNAADTLLFKAVTTSTVDGQPMALPSQEPTGILPARYPSSHSQQLHHQQPKPMESWLNSTTPVETLPSPNEVQRDTGQTNRHMDIINDNLVEPVYHPQSCMIYLPMSNLNHSCRFCGTDLDFHELPPLVQ